MNSEIIFIISGLCGIITLILYHVKRLHLYREAAKFPGPPTIPILGNACYFLGNHEDILNKMNALQDTYPSPFRVWLGNRLYFAINDADQIKLILNSPNSMEKEEMYKYMRPWLGTGLITGPVSKWRLHRKIIQPTFNKRILDSFVEIFAKQAEILTTKMRKEVNKGEFDIFRYVSLCTLDIVCESVMGVSLNAQSGIYSQYVEYSRREMQIMYLRMIRVWLHFDFIFNMTKLGKDERKYLDYLHSITNDVIRKKKSEYENGTPVTNGTNPATTRKAFLDLMMTNDESKLTDDDLRDEVETMIVAGNDTTASIDSFVTLMLANFPDVQEKVYQELCDILGDDISSDVPITKEDLSRMEYLERVIKETMRLFPAGQILARNVTDDIKMGDLTFPKGSSVAIGVVHVHRNAKYYPDPLKFDPDRFLPEEVAKRNPYCYLPFSGGPRGCVGMVFGIMAMKVVVATIVRRYVLKRDKFVRIEDIRLTADLLLKTVEPLTVKIVERKYDEKIKSK